MGHQVLAGDWWNGWCILYPWGLIWNYMDVFWHDWRFPVYHHPVNSHNWFCPFLGWELGWKLWGNWIQSLVSISRCHFLIQCCAVFLVHVLKPHSLTMETNNLHPYGSNVESNSTTLSVILSPIWSSNWHITMLRLVFLKFLFPIGCFSTMKFRSSLENLFGPDWRNWQE